MRILLLFRLSLQRGLNVLQYLNLACIERVGGRAGRPTLACQRQLHDAHRRRERHHHQFLQPDAVLKLARLDVQSLPFDRAEGLFNMPALAIPTDAPARFLQRAHGVRGQQPPMNRRFVTDHGRGVFDDIDHVQRQVRRGLLVGAIPGLFERYRAETNMQQCFMGAALGRDGQGDPVTTLYGLLIHPVEQGHVTDRGQVAIAAGADQQVRARIRYAVPQLVDVGFPIGDRGDCGRFRQPFFAGYHGVDPAHAFLFFNRELFVMGRFPLRALPQVQVGQSKTGAFVGIDRQQRVNKKTQITSVAHRPQSVDASAMALQVDFAAVLDRQDMPSLAARIRAGTGAGNQFLGAHARVGQKSAETNFPSPVPAQLSKAYVLSADQLLMQFRSRFFKRASPKPPSAYRSIRSSCPIRSILLTSQIKLGRRKHSPCRRCVHTVACGTGGFLVMAMNHVLAMIDEKHRNRWPKRGPSAEQQAEWFRARHQFLSQNMYGLDLNPNLVRAAKMNMVMNNDGSGNLFQCNSLEHPHRWPAEGPSPSLLGSVDVIFANPPFGTEITIDDPRILAQFNVGAVWDPTEKGFVQRTTKDGKAALQSSQSPEVLFVERCLQFLKPGGRMAIVLPNGLLNNPGLAYFRKCILSQAQLLAVVDMHRDLFQPRNDTQTSMVLLRKWSEGESAESHGDYPVFMAIADKIGHNKRGNTVFKRAPDGSLLLEDTVRKHRIVKADGSFEEVAVTSKEPIIDDELNDVADAYHHWLAEQLTPVRKRKEKSLVA